MLALRTMLQPKSASSQPIPSPSTHDSVLAADLSSNPNYHSSSSSNHSHHHTHSGSSSGHGLASSSLFHPEKGQSATLTSGATTSATLTTAVGSKAASSVKKSAPFQNLGLHSGAASGNLGLVKFALDNGQPIDSVLNGVYPIHAACCSNANIAVVMYLLERGADVNARRLPRKYSSEKNVQTVGTTGSTPLHFAAANGCLAVVDILLRHGAVVDMTDKYGSSPLSVAAARNHPDVASLLRQYSAMQRGVQDLTPDNEAKDPIVDRRSSSEFGYRSPSMTPSVRSPTRESVPQSPSAQSARSVQTNRSPGQRRISMPSITESPSPADIPPMPRQSCDLGRTPQSTEPLVRNSGSVRSKPTRNTTLIPLTPDDRPPKTPTRDLSDPTMNKNKGHSSRGMKRSHTTLGSSGSGSGSGSGNRHSRESSRANANANGGSQGHPLTTSSTHKVKRRKSMESAGFLSPQSAAPTQRRKSFDQITDLTRGHLKSRRSSDASTASQGTASSASSGTSHTSVSDHTLESNRDRHGQSNHHNNSNHNHSNASTMTVENASVHELPDNSDTASVASVVSAVSVVSVASIAPSPPLSRSLSQPLVEQVKRRKPLPFAMDSSIRQSLDLQRLMSNQDRTGGKAKESEVRNESDSDLPGVLSRRRTMETAPTRHGTLPRYNGGGHVVEAMSRASISEENPSRSQQLRFQQSTSGSSTSLQDMAQQHPSRGSGHGASASYSGSGTVTGRLSRMWSSSSSSTSSKESVSSGTWNAGEFGEASGEAATQALSRTESNRLRGSNGGGAANGGMLNRLSGLWSRR